MSARPAGRGTARRWCVAMTASDISSTSSAGGRPAPACSGAARGDHRSPAVILYAGAEKRGQLGANDQVEAVRRVQGETPMKSCAARRSPRPWPLPALAQAQRRSDPPRPLAVDRRAGAPGRRILREERRPAPTTRCRSRSSRASSSAAGKEVNEMIRQGANVMNITDPGYLSDFVPDIGVLNGPYLVEDPDHLRQAAGLRLVQRRREEARSRRVQAGDGERLLRPAPPDRRQAGPQARRHGRHDRAGAAEHDVDRDLQSRSARGRPPCSGPRSTTRCSRTSCRRRGAARLAVGLASCTRRARSSR